MKKRAYLIGIGGIGVSALARKYLSEGWEVAGSDRAGSKITAELEKLGAKINLEQKAENISGDFDLVIYTIAISPEHPELSRARELNLPVLSYPEALGELSKTHFTIAVSGTHGKTTTTAMLAEVALAAGLDPTVIVGSLLASSGANFIAGQSDLLIVEACEYRRSFLNLSPKILIITNIEADHLDYYRDLEDIQDAFAELASKLPSDGALICDKTDANLQPVLKMAEKTGCKIIDYKKIKTDFKLKIPGAHNIKNAQAALGVAAELHLLYHTALEALENFAGTWRRFEFKGETKTGAKVYDDYAHHPSEIRATLAGARELVEKSEEEKGGKIFVIFQPHLYSRTKQLFLEFSESFADADEVILADIYAAREAPDPEISSEKLAKVSKNKSGESAKYFKNFTEIVAYLKQATQAGDLIITMGAGDIGQVAELLLK
ncbi:MAG: UDP-N-acetylmuramate--L-alanine ligase [Patescibacteria group bacterium]